MIAHCSLYTWQLANKPLYDWYYKTYPFLNQFILPIPYNDLLNFYVDDIEKRNLKPVQEFVDCYEFLFSYFLENYNKKDEDKFFAKTFLENSLENLPKVFKETINDIGDVLGTTSTIIFIAIIIIVALIIIIKFL